MARYLIDANLPRYISVWPDAECTFVADLDARMTDSAIWAFAVQHALTIVTKDADFADRVFLSRDGPRVIHLRLGNMKFRELDAFLSRVWEDVCALSEQHRLVQVFADRIEAISVDSN